MNTNVFTIYLDPTLDYSCRSLSLSLPYHNGMVPTSTRTIGKLQIYEIIEFCNQLSIHKNQFLLIQNRRQSLLSMKLNAILPSSAQDPALAGLS